MNNDEVLNTSIDEYLISLADSVNHAQRYISGLRVPGENGQPTITYQLPRVDFELKMQFQVVSDPPPSGGLQRNIAKSDGGGYLEARPFGASTDKSTSELASTIKGSFVAVPIYGGNSPPLIDITWQRSGGEGGENTFDLTVTAREAATDQGLAGRNVQFNIDRDLYEKLSGKAIDPKDRPNLSVSVTETDASGRATTIVTLPRLMTARVPIVIDALGRTETLVFSPDWKVE